MGRGVDFLRKAGSLPLAMLALSATSECYRMRDGLTYVRALEEEVGPGDVRVEFDLAVKGDRMTVSYTVINGGSSPVVVFDRRRTPAGDNVAYDPPVASTRFDQDWFVLALDSRNHRVTLTRGIPKFQFWTHGDLPLGRQLEPGAGLTDSFETPLPLGMGRWESSGGKGAEVVVRYVAMRIGYITDIPFDARDRYRFEIGSEVIWYFPPFAWRWAGEHCVFATSASQPVEIRVVPPGRQGPPW